MCLKNKFVSSFLGENFVILDSPLLYESRLSKWMKKVIVVNWCVSLKNLLRLANISFISSEEQQLVRVMKRNNYTADEARQRINAQIALEEKCKWADYVIDNSASLQHTREQVENIHKTIKTISQHHGLYLWVFIATLSIALLSTLHYYLYNKFIS